MSVQEGKIAELDPGFWSMGHTLLTVFFFLSGWESVFPLLLNQLLSCCFQAEEVMYSCIYCLTFLSEPFDHSIISKQNDEGQKSSLLRLQDVAKQLKEQISQNRTRNDQSRSCLQQKASCTHCVLPCADCSFPMQPRIQDFSQGGPDRKRARIMGVLALSFAQRNVCK